MKPVSPSIHVGSSSSLVKDIAGDIPRKLPFLGSEEFFKSLHFFAEPVLTVERNWKHGVKAKLTKQKGCKKNE